SCGPTTASWRTARRRFASAGPGAHHAPTAISFEALILMRIERDTLGEVQVPDDALYGAQTQRAVENYPISGLREHPTFIRTFIVLKKSAAVTNRELGALDEERANAIITACDRILGDFANHRKHFV